MLGRSISRNSLLLGLFAAATAGVIATTFQATKSRIAIEERKAASAAFIEMVPKSQHDNEMLDDTLTLTLENSQALGFDERVTLNIAKKNGKVVALILPAIAKDGYSGDIKLITAINRDGSLAGVRIISHKETPGLGDKIDTRKSPWVYSFNTLSLQNLPVTMWNVKKDGGHFDQFTGATITPRAIVKRVHKNLLAFEENKANWLYQAEQQ